VVIVVKTTAEVTALLEEDVMEFLEQIGVADDYRAGTLTCVICGTPLLDGGLGAARGIDDGTFEFACARLDCLEAFHARGGGA
jgi:hypothetical protein